MIAWSNYFDISVVANVLKILLFLGFSVTKLVLRRISVHISHTFFQESMLRGFTETKKEKTRNSLFKKDKATLHVISKRCEDTNHF